MDGYRILQRLGKGTQGSVYLVERRVDRKQLVMKKVECKDECEANRAFKEAMALKKLQHPHICGYQHFFVAWDKEVSSMFVCIVMDYYESGDLGQLLREKRNACEKVEEELIQKWLGQILDSLVFIHKKQIIHRDLKPSNIFLRKVTDLVIGDFGVATIMADARTNTRAAIGSMNWMAPEVLERASDERSDVWSLGCIALEMVTCSFIDSTDMAGKLFEVKHSDDALDVIMQQVATLYTEELVEVIGKMLQRNYTNRLTSSELSEKRYMRECMAMDINVGEASTAERVVISRAVPDGDNMQAITAYMVEQWSNASSMQQAFVHLCSLADSTLRPLKLDLQGQQVVVSAMNAHLPVIDIQILGCKILESVASAAKSDDFVYTSDVISTVVDTMKKHTESPELNLAAVRLLVALSADGGACAAIGNVGGVKSLVAAMKFFIKNVDVATACCDAIWSLSVSDDNCRLVANSQCISDVHEALVQHPHSSQLITAAFAALMSMFLEDRNVQLSNTLDCVLHIVTGIERHISDAKLVKNGCLALATIVECDEESAFNLFRNERPGGEEVEGIPILIRAYQQHNDNADVIESICMTFMELVEYDEIRSEMKHLKIDTDILYKVQKRFKDNTDILSSCEAALAKLELSK